MFAGLENPSGKATEHEGECYAFCGSIFERDHHHVELIVLNRTERIDMKAPRKKNPGGRPPGLFVFV